MEESLRVSKEQLDHAIRGSSDGFWDWTDMENDVIWWSPQLFELLGYKNLEFNPSVNTFFQFIHPEDKHQVEKSSFPETNQ